MKISKIRILTIFMLFLVISLSLSPFALAKTRKTYLSDFLLDNLIEDKGFSNCDREDYREDKIEVSYEATTYALDILGKYNLLEEKDLFGKVEKSYNSSDLQDELEEYLNSMYVSGFEDIYDTYYILKSLEEICEVVRGSHGYGSKDYLKTAEDKSYKFLQIQNLKGGKVDTSKVKYVFRKNKNATIIQISFRFPDQWFFNYVSTNVAIAINCSA